MTRRPIPDYPGYFVGDDGSFWKWLAGAKLASRQKYSPARWKQLKARDNGKGMEIAVFRDGVKATLSLAATVLRAFGRPRPLGHEPLFFPDRDYRNCRNDNLRWAPRGESRRGNPCPAGRANILKAQEACRLFSDEEVRQIREMYSDREIAIDEIADLFGVSSSVIAKVGSGASYRHVAGPVPPIRGFGKTLNHPNLKLSEPRIRAMIRLRRMGWTQGRIADWAGVSLSLVSLVLKGKAWAQVTGITSKESDFNLGVKLTAPRVRAVIRLRRIGWSQKKIADWAGVSKANIQCILSGSTWSHVTGISPRSGQVRSA